jgi:hypothetical protein
VANHHDTLGLVVAVSIDNRMDLGIVRSYFCGRSERR